MATNLDSYRNVISRKLGLDNSVDSFERTLVDGWVNDALIDFLVRTRVTVTSSTLVVSTADTVLPTSFLAVNDIYVTTLEGQSFPLERIPVQELLRYRLVTTVSTPIRFYALNGNDLLMVHPVPSSALTLTVYGVPRPAQLTSSLDVPAIPAEYHKALEYYALAEAADYMDNPKAPQYRQLYTQELTKIKKSMWHKGGRSLGRVIGGVRGSVVPPRNDIDWR